MSNKGAALGALRAAFPKTIPIMAGFGFIGLSYGMYARASGLDFWYPTLMSLVVFGGSLEFVAVSLLTQPFNPIQTFIVTIMIQARHLFYSIAMLDRYKNTGKKKAYLIYGLCDETFSVNCSAVVPLGVDAGWFYLWITLLNHFYWVFGSTLGGMLGGLSAFDTRGIDFVLTAMFVVIFLEQWLKERAHHTALIGLGVSVLCLVIFGQDSFLIPSMAAILGLLTLFRGPMERAGV